MKKRKKISQNVFERILLRKRKLVKSKVDLFAVHRPHPDKKGDKNPLSFIPCRICNAYNMQTISFIHI